MTVASHKAQQLDRLIEGDLDLVPGSADFAETIAVVKRSLVRDPNPFSSRLCVTLMVEAAAEDLPIEPVMIPVAESHPSCHAGHLSGLARWLPSTLRRTLATLASAVVTAALVVIFLAPRLGHIPGQSVHQKQNSAASGTTRGLLWGRPTSSAPNPVAWAVTGGPASVAAALGGSHTETTPALAVQSTYALSASVSDVATGPNAGTTMGSTDPPSACQGARLTQAGAMLSLGGSVLTVRADISGGAVTTVRVLVSNVSFSIAGSGSFSGAVHMSSPLIDNIRVMIGACAGSLVASTTTNG